ncbi:MAG: hypothetical protein ACP5FL_09165, partial [Thermoplasmatota archaeon]
ASTQIDIVQYGIEIDTPTVLIRGENTTIAGTALAGGERLDNTSVMIQFDQTTLYRGATDTNGHFQVIHQVDEALGNHTLSYSLPSYDYHEETTVFVKERTKLQLKNISAISPGETGSATVTLLTNNSQPLRQMTVVFHQTQSSNTTNVSGSCSFSCSIPDDWSKETYPVAVSFQGTHKYCASSLQKNLSVNLSAKKGLLASIWQYLLLISAVVAAGTITMVYRKRKNQDISEADEEGPSGPQILRATPSDNTQLNVQFPQIQSPFPAVWGTNDELTIQCILKQHKEKVADASIKLYIDKNLQDTPISDINGTAEIYHTFTQKGSHTVKASYETDDASATDTESVTIVEYREEAIRLFNTVLEKINETGVQIPKAATPRTIKKHLLKMNADREAAHRLINIFEEAEYSNHPFSRDKYEQMYLSYLTLINEVKTYERENTTGD